MAYIPQQNTTHPTGGGSVTGQVKPSQNDFWFTRPGFGVSKSPFTSGYAQTTMDTVRDAMPAAQQSPFGADYAQNMMDLTRQNMPEQKYDPSKPLVFGGQRKTPGRDYGTPKSFNYATMQEAMADQPGHATRDKGLLVGRDSPLAGALAESLRKNQQIKDQYGGWNEWVAAGQPSLNSGTSALDVLNGVGTPDAQVTPTNNGTSGFDVLNNAMMGVQPMTNRFWETWGRG